MMVGQKVVCVDDRFDPVWQKYYRKFPVRDVLYVIRDVLLGVNGRGESGEVCVYLVGVENPYSDKPPYPERGFNAERFRPLETRTERDDRVNAVPAEVLR